MKTVHEVSAISGVSVRTLQYYDSIGLLPPTAHTEAGYRLYDDAALERLAEILLYRELQFPLREIRQILCDPDVDRSTVLFQQIRLLEMRREHIDNLLTLARGMKVMGVKSLLDFQAFDTRKIDEYERAAKASWGKTEAWKEYEEKSRGRTQEEVHSLSVQMMECMAALGRYREEAPESAAVQEQVAALQQFITDHFYTCTDEILSSLGMMYAGGGDMTAHIDGTCGEGTGAFIQKAIACYVASRKH
ncbi:MAG: MerR family transcriptional regulator [Clostridia bacterium]|nr:MerR family transcriptional regulator [Clostridia bacterium]